jgi:cephalosporin-C deacetylase-like acetyl esterase
VTVSSAGVGKPRGPSYGYAAQGILTLSLGVHDHDLLLPKAEYRKMSRGRLKAYYQQGAPDREKYYFRRAILGIDRAITWLASRPDYDGKHMLYYGSSQGGGFGLILAGLNPHITAMAANVPALCDHTGALANRSPGWPRLVGRCPPDQKKAYLKMSGYFDAVNFARKIRCPVLLSVGLIDSTCSPSSVYAAYNEIRSQKRIFAGPLTGHGTPPDFGKYLAKWKPGQLGRGKPLPPTTIDSQPASLQE